jgi:hypothetical protein
MRMALTATERVNDAYRQIKECADSPRVQLKIKDITKTAQGFFTTSRQCAKPTGRLTDTWEIGEQRWQTGCQI